MALFEAGRFEWSEFQQRLIAAVGRWETEHPDGEGYRYYERWAEALESLLGRSGIVAVETSTSGGGARRPPRRARPRPRPRSRATTRLTMASEPRHSAVAEARWEAGYRADVTVRQFRFVVDEPPQSGGEDAGAMPTEYLLVALSSCFAMALGHVARKRELALGPLTVRAVATYDGPSFSAIDLEVVFDDGPPDGDRRTRRAGLAGSATCRTRWPGSPH